MEANQEADILSSFPDEILINIISFLPLKEAVQTCLLSRRWRNLFPLVTNLNLEDIDFVRKRYKMCDFINFVDRFLSCHAANIVDKLFIKCVGSLGSLYFDGVDKWIKYALHKKVRELDLCSYCNIFDMGQSGIFTCNTLEVLRLSSNIILKLPANIGLPSLKFLQFSNMKFEDEDSLQTLISSCSVLEELVILGCYLTKSCKFNVFNRTLKRLTIKDPWGYEEVAIDAPSLVYFKYYSQLPERFLLRNLNSLVKVHIGFTVSPSYNSTAIDLFEAITHVQSLELSDFVAEVILKHVASIAFPWSQLKTLRISRFGGAKNELEMVEYFLKNAKALENLTIHIVTTKRDMAAEWRSRITSLPKVAEDCKILVA